MITFGNQNISREISHNWRGEFWKSKISRDNLQIPRWRKCTVFWSNTTLTSWTATPRLSSPRWASFRQNEYLRQGCQVSSGPLFFGRKLSMSWFSSPPVLGHVPSHSGQHWDLPGCDQKRIQRPPQGLTLTMILKDATLHWIEEMCLSLVDTTLHLNYRCTKSTTWRGPQWTGRPARRKEGSPCLRWRCKILLKTLCDIKKLSWLYRVLQSFFRTMTLLLTD